MPRPVTGKYKYPEKVNCATFTVLIISDSVSPLHLVHEEVEDFKDDWTS